MVVHDAGFGLATGQSVSGTTLRFRTDTVQLDADAGIQEADVSPAKVMRRMC